jgi:PAS domain-containing protein
VLALPVAAQSHFFTIVAFVGGVSAATAMVIVETIALAIMVSNNIVVPLVLLRQGENNMFQQREGETRSTALVKIRRMSICIILFLAYLYYWLAGNAAALAQTGLISFAAIAQFAPSFFGGCVLAQRDGTWCCRRHHRRLCGVGLHAAHSQLHRFRLAGNRALARRPLRHCRPQAAAACWASNSTPSPMACCGACSPISRPMLAFSALRPPNRIEALQAEAFLPDTRAGSGLAGFRLWRSSVTLGQVEETVARYLGAEKTREAFDGMVRMRGLANDPAIEADVGILNFGEHLLASAIGPASSRLVMALLLERHAKGSRDAIQLLDDASSAIEHSRSVLQSAIDNVPQGIVVFDQAGALVSWNAAVKDVLALPAAMLKVGTRIDEFLVYVGTRTLEPEARQANAIAARRTSFSRAKGHWRQRLVEPLCVVDIHSGKLPDGGIVVSFSDVTETVAAADALMLANETLELRVAERTAELTKLNGELAKAKAEADAANQGKTRFFAAASHDILQPLNAARLFTSTLVEGSRRRTRPSCAMSMRHWRRWKTFSPRSSTFRGSMQVPSSRRSRASSCRSFSTRWRASLSGRPATSISRCVSCNLGRGEIGPQAPAPRAAEPRLQRHQVHGERPCAGGRAAQGQRLPDRGSRHGAWHSRGAIAHRFPRVRAPGP